MTARELALKVLVGVEKGQGLSDSLIKDEFDRAGLKAVDRALARELVAGVLRNRSLLDWILGGSLRKGIGSLSPAEANILRLGAYQLCLMDRVPDFAAVDESVRLSKRFARRGVVGLTNAVLRDIIEKRPRLRKPSSGDPVSDLAILWSHPRWLVKRWIDRLGAEETAQLLEIDNRPAPVCLWPNLLRTDLECLIRELEAGGFQPRRHPLVPEALELGRPAGIFDHRIFKDGHFYLQDPAAQLVGRLVDPKPGQSVLDVCAAPGGKACWTASRGRDVVVVAADLSRAKMGSLAQNAFRLGLGNILVVCSDGLFPCYNRQFDTVLIDAPCSGLGVLRRRLDLRWRITEKDIARLAGLQARLLRAVAQLVRPGGALIYATCTLTAEENQGQVSKFLEDNREFHLEPADARVPIQAVSNGMLEAWPHRLGTDGAFAARMIRIK